MGNNSLNIFDVYVFCCRVILTASQQASQSKAALLVVLSTFLRFSEL